MYHCGIDAYIEQLRVAVLNKGGQLLIEQNVSCDEPDRLVAVLRPYRPLSVVVETCPSWPWLHELLVGEGADCHLAHAKHLRMIAHNAQEKDAVDVCLLARMLLAGLIPEAHQRVDTQRDWLRLVRHHAAVVSQRTSW